MPIHFQMRAVAALQHVQIGDDSALGVEVKRINALAGEQARFCFLVPGLVGEKVVEEGKSILAGQFEEAALGQIDHAATFVEGGVLGLRFAEGGDDLGFGVRLKFGLGLLMQRVKRVGQRRGHGSIVQDDIGGGDAVRQNETE